MIHEFALALLILAGAAFALAVSILILYAVIIGIYSAFIEFKNRRSKNGKKKEYRRTLPGSIDYVCTTQGDKKRKSRTSKAR